MKRITLLFGLLIAPVACQELVDPLPEPANFQGQVARVVGLEPLQLEVNSIEPLDAGVAAYPSSTTVYGADDVRLIRQQDSELEAITAEQIMVGDRVRVWIAAELRSDPVQYSAAQISVEGGT